MARKGFLQARLVPYQRKLADSRMMSKRGFEASLDVYERNDADCVVDGVPMPNWAEEAAVACILARDMGYSDAVRCADAMPVMTAAFGDADRCQEVLLDELADALGDDARGLSEKLDARIESVDTGHFLHALYGLSEPTAPLIMPVPKALRAPVGNADGEELVPDCLLVAPAVEDGVATSLRVVAYDTASRKRPALSLLPSVPMAATAALRHASATYARSTMYDPASAFAPAGQPPEAIRRVPELMEAVDAVSRTGGNPKLHSLPLAVYALNLLLLRFAWLPDACEEDPDEVLSRLEKEHSDHLAELMRAEEAKRLSLERRLSARDDEVASLRAEVAATRATAELSADEARSLRRRVAELERELKAAGSTVLADDEGATSPIVSNDDAAAPTFFRMPEDPGSALALASELYGDRIEVLPSAMASARDWRGTGAAELWECVTALADGVWSMAFGQGATLTDEAIKLATGMDCATRASKWAKNDDMYRKGCTFDYHGVPEFMPMHMKGAKTQGKQALRVHFMLDDDARRIVIGYAGKHISSSRSPGKS